MLLQGLHPRGTHFGVMEQLGRQFFDKSNIDDVIAQVVSKIGQTFGVSIDSKHDTFIHEFQEIAKATLNDNANHLRGLPMGSQLQELNGLVFRDFLAHVGRRVQEHERQTGMKHQPQPVASAGRAGPPPRTSASIAHPSGGPPHQGPGPRHPVPSPMARPIRPPDTPGPSASVAPPPPPEPKVVTERMEIVIDPCNDTTTLQPYAPDGPTAIFPLRLDGVRQIRVLCIDFDPSDYNVHEGCNVFRYAVGDDSTMTNVTSEIPVGTYNTLWELSEAIGRSCPELKLVFDELSETWTVSLDDIREIRGWEKNPAESEPKPKLTRLHLQFDHENSIAPLLGFENKVYMGNDRYIAPGKHASHRDARYITLDIKEMGFTTVIPIPSANDHIHLVPKTKGKNVYSAPCLRRFPSPVHISQFTVHFKRPSGSSYNFRGQPWYVVLEVMTEKLIPTR